MRYSIFISTILFFTSLKGGLSLVCLPAENDGDSITPPMAAYLDIDGYSNRSVKTCSSDGCDEVDNFKYCKSPTPKFILKEIGSDGTTFVVSNRCDNGFKKFVSISNASESSNFLFEEKMLYQMKHQMWASTSFVGQPVLELKKKNDYYELVIQDFIEDLWQAEWEREDIDISLFTTIEEEAKSYKTICLKDDKFESIDQLKKIHLKSN